MRIALVSMPWALFNRPSIQLGALKAFLESSDEDIRVRAMHPFLDAARLLGPETYTLIAKNNWAGEAVYAAQLFPKRIQRIEGVFHKALQRRKARCDWSFAELCDLLGSHLQDWIADTDFSQFDLIGFSVCFSQLNATLAAIKMLKAEYPDLPLVLGGSSCVGGLGISLLRCFPEIDFIISGEGELPLLGLCRYLKTGDGSSLRGVILRDTLDTESEMVETTDLNQLPLPDYSDYFKEMQADQGNATLIFSPTLPLEFSRGCWWNRCTFCNLNLQWRCYRRKKAWRILDEITTLSKRHACLNFTFTDNALPPVESEQLFISLAEADRDFRFFGEIRSIKKAASYALLRRGGLHSVQIGIEALSGKLLKYMDKGVGVMDNVAAMKYAQAAEMRLDGNLILEFPGSDEEDVQSTLAVLKKILPYHPLQAAAFFLGHGSPACEQPGDFGIQAVLQHPFSRAFYPDEILQKLDMLIKAYRGDRMRQRRLWQPVRDMLLRWQDFHQDRLCRGAKQPPLSLREGGNFLLIRQERPGSETLHHRLHGTSRKIYLACAEPRSIKELLSAFKSITKEQLIVFLSDLEKKHLLFRDNDLYLALAVHYSG